MTEYSQNLVATRFLQRATENPERPAVVFTDITYSFGMIRELAATFAIKLADIGIDENSTLQLKTNDLPVVLGALLACSILGTRLVEEAVSEKTDTGFPVTHTLVTSSSINAPNRIVVDETWSPANFEPGERVRAWTEGKADACSPWLIVRTSTTKSFPNIVGLSQEIVTARSDALTNDFKTDETRFVSLFPYSSFRFFARAIAALLAGATIVDHGPWQFWVEAGVNLISGSSEVMEVLIKDGPHQPKIAMSEVTGAKLSAKDATSILHSFEMIDDAYDPVETGKSYSNLHILGSGGKVETRGISCGSTIEILSGAEKPISSDISGSVRIKSALSAERYLFTLSGVRKVLQDGWFVTGDLALWGAHETLIMGGRTDADLLRFGDIKVKAEIVDKTITSVEGIEDAVAFVSPKPESNEIIAFVVFEEDVNRAQLGELAKMACRDQFGDDAAPAKIWPIDAVPRHPDGRADRDQCAAMIIRAASRAI